MKLKFIILALTLGLFQTAFGQEIPAANQNTQGYLIGPGDVVTAKVPMEKEFDFIATVDEDGKIEVPFFDKPIMAKCRTERQLRAEVTELLSKYLRNAQVNLNIERRSRPPATIYGEVRNPQRVELRRNARLLELLSFAGGVTEKAGGMIQVFRTQPEMCGEGGDKNNWVVNGDPTSVPARMYSLSTLRQGREEANPEILPGDVILVEKAPPVYVIGEVMALREIFITEQGLSLLEAVAQAGGPNRDAKTKNITIHRLKENSKEREKIAVNYDQVRKGEQKDVILQPYDIVEINKSKKSFGETLLEIATGGLRTAITTTLPTSILY